MVSHLAFFSLCFALLSAAILPTVESHQLRRPMPSDHNVPAEHKDGSHRRRRTLACPDPASVHYQASVHLSVYAGDHTCTAAEEAYIGARIAYHWSKYVAYNAEVGAFDIQVGDVCTANRRLTQDSAATRYDRHGRRKLGFFDFNFAAGGICWLCWADSDDDRRTRRLSATVPVTFQFQTDQFPGEIWFKVKDPAGYSVINHDELFGARPHSLFNVTYDLIPGVTYTFIKKDRYGDGWCCLHGYGGVKIFDGIPATGMDLIASFNGDFVSHQKETFVVPTQGVTARSAGFPNPADVLFPELESGLSTYLSYYIHDEFHIDGNSCLFKKYPSIWVDLEQVSPNSPPISC